MNTQTGLKDPSGLAASASPLWEVSVSGATSGVGIASAPEFSVPLLAPPCPAFPRVHAEVGRYRLRLAQSIEDRDAACRLRFKVFNIELGKGLDASYETGLDTDQFDLFCEHLLVEDKVDRRIVGTYRMQSGITAEQNLGYYSQQEFGFAPYEAMRGEILELGRASIDREHRTPEVLTLLWRGIAQYATDMQLRYLIGCSSLNSVDPREGWQMYRQLTNYRAAAELQTLPAEGFICPGEHEDSESGSAKESDLTPASEPAKVPKLLKTYLAIGARICSAPAWDREFGTIDFLTLLDLRTISSSARNRFLAPLAE
ncbi:GNAT family N-acetyltransferase [Acidicapsa acidisoli]|uniref:GNAT family N-acetyltransferase n=1 Tax=Acidicapsa acidisoli TaxID=1615681 RepID=UPI0021E0BEC8|nr:GNAT family N-acyltransferase [Acidicapsa acidisoli]